MNEFVALASAVIGAAAGLGSFMGATRAHLKNISLSLRRIEHSLGKHNEALDDHSIRITVLEKAREKT